MDKSQKEYLWHVGLGKNIGNKEGTSLSLAKVG